MVYRDLALGKPYTRMITLTSNKKQNIYGADVSIRRHIRYRRRRLDGLFRDPKVIANESAEQRTFEERVVQDNENIDLNIGDACFDIFKRFNYTLRAGYSNHVNLA